MATDPVAEVQKYIDTVKATRDELQSAGEKATDQANRLAELEAEIGDKAGGFAKDVEEFCSESLQGEWGEIKQQLEEWTTGLGEMVSEKLAQGMQYLEEQETQSGEILSTLQQNLNQDFEELSGQGFDAVEEGHSGLEGEVGDLKQMTEQAFSALGDGIDAMESTLEQVKSATLDHFSNMSSDLTGAITSTMESAFEEMSTAISDTALGDITQGFGDLGEQFTQLFESFSGSVEEVASGLMEKGAEIFSDMVEHAKNEAMEKIGQEVEEAVREFIEALIQEFIESIGLMTIGSATTTALAPYVPLLVAAKNICGTINDLLEVMNLGA